MRIKGRDSEVELTRRPGGKVDATCIDHPGSQWGCDWSNRYPSEAAARAQATAHRDDGN